MEFRNFSGEVIEQITTNENHSQQLTINRSRVSENITDGNKEIADNTPAYHSREDGSSDTKVGNTQHHISSTAMGEKWGSSFWNDCQPTTSRGASESGEESKSDSEYKGSELEESDGAEDMMAHEIDDIRHERVAGKGHQIIPADEMLSDEYYEQDGEDQRDSRNHNRVMNHSRGFSSKPPPRPTAPSNNYRKSKGSNVNHQYNNEEVDYEDDDDEEDEDDPDDADFDPDYGATGSQRGIKDKDDDWDAEGSDEEDNIDEDDLDVLDENDAYSKRNRTKKPGKGGRQVKTLKPSARRQTNRTFDDDEELAEDSENDTYDDFRSRKRRGGPIHRRNGGQSASVSVSGRDNEPRTSGRSIRKVSYVESDDESEDQDGGKKKKSKG